MFLLSYPLTGILVEVFFSSGFKYSFETILSPFGDSSNIVPLLSTFEVCFKAITFAFSPRNILIFPIFTSIYGINFPSLISVPNCTSSIKSNDLILAPLFHFVRSTIPLPQSNIYNPFSFIG